MWIFPTFVGVSVTNPAGVSQIDPPASRWISEQEGAAAAAVEFAIAEFGRIDVVVNNAGYANSAPIEETDPADFRAQIESEWGVDGASGVISASGYLFARPQPYGGSGLTWASILSPEHRVPHRLL